jgi:hypothetical protein
VFYRVSVLVLASESEVAETSWSRMGFVVEQKTVDVCRKFVVEDSELYVDIVADVVFEVSHSHFTHW